MDLPFPPHPRQDDLRKELSLVPKRHREDAFQEAWVAYLEGRDPAVAVNSYAKKKSREDNLGYIDDDNETAVDGGARFELQDRSRSTVV